MPVDTLPSARLRNAGENLAAFVRRARDGVAAFGADLPFDAPAWDVSRSQTGRASAGHQKAALYFTTHDGGTSKGVEGRTPLVEPFAAWLKSIVRLREERGHVAHTLHCTLIRAGRYLYEATVHVGHDPCRLLPMHFDDAARLCRDREMASSRYRVGMALALIADWVNRYNLSSARIDFRNPFPRGDDGTRIGAAADARRADKLPSEAALDAIARIANMAEEPADVLRVRILELLACGGWRINEILTVREECEVADPVFRNGEPVAGADGRQAENYGISYFGEKGAGARIKWIPTPMVDVAKRAITDIRRITAPSREAARWMEAHPGRAWLPPGWRDRDEFSTADIAGMFALSGSVAAAAMVRGFGIPFRVDVRNWVVARPDIEASLLARQPGLPRTDVPLSKPEYLFLMPRNWAHATRASIASIAEFVTDAAVADFITGRAGVRTCFERFGLTEDDGSPIEITSHQFRHWLNTLAQQGGMSQMEIARWSGRKDVRQNSAYDHVSGVVLAEQARALLAAGKVHGPVAQAQARLPPARREDFRRAQIETAHTTDLGMCVNDWTTAPCVEHGACAGCEQHLVVKGDPRQRGRAETLLAEHEALLRKAESEAQEETWGASNWAAHHRRTRDALAGILAVHGDAAVPDGDLVHLRLPAAERGRRPLDGGSKR